MNPDIELQLNNRSPKEIFKEGSTTFYYASMFFPAEIRKDVTDLYAFLRQADNFVDCDPQQEDNFLTLKAETLNSLVTGRSKYKIINGFVSVSQKYGFYPEWTEAFLNSMEADLNHKPYKTFDELQPYIYGSAEVIGLMLSAVMKLPKESYPYAQLLGRGKQFLNFIRDIAEDIDLGRTYMPTDDMQEFGIQSFSEVLKDPTSDNFRAFIQKEVNICLDLFNKAEDGFSFIPSKPRIAIQTATDMQRWTASRIYNNPETIFGRKVKPPIPTILFSGLQNTIRI